MFAINGVTAMVVQLDLFVGADKAGWVCQSIEDLGDVCASCQVCGTSIRYVHVLAHNDEMARVGCVCAARMEADEKAAARREQRFKAVLGWKWRTSAKGNRYRNLKVGAFSLNVVLYDGGVRLINRETGESTTRTFATEAATLGWLALALEKLGRNAKGVSHDQT
jgi:hypothetical protein